MKKTNASQDKSMSQIIMLSAWSFIIVVSSILYMYVGHLIDTAMNSEPFFMIGLLVLGITLSILRMYKECTTTSATQDLEELEQNV